MPDGHWPSEVRLAKGGKRLTIAFESGETFEITAELLRVHSPSAEVQGHAPGERQTVPGKREVAILDVLAVGNYAVRLSFDDMHSTGIYSWDFLHDLGSRQAEMLAAYEEELAQKGLSRDPVRRGGMSGKR